MHGAKILIARATTIAVALAISFAAMTMAQDKTAQPQNAPSAPLVKLNVLVLNEQNRAADDVSQDEFHIYEENTEQQISFFSKEEIPLSYGLLVDNSGSLRDQFPQVLLAAKSIINKSKPDDEAFVIRFVTGEKIDVVQDFTSSMGSLLDALDSMETENGATALIDAIYLSAQHISERAKTDGIKPRRHALILITDGQDLNSYYNPDALFKLLRESDVQIFIIGLVQKLEKDPGIYFKKYSRKRATDLLDRLAQQTGGLAYYPRSEAEVTQAANEIMQDLRTQYIIGYTPAKIPKSKTYRKLKVMLVRAKERAPGRVVARPGYTATGNPAQQKS